ncbi:hypothetical protein TCON_1955 [Astathelohania contejeani]|uniref:Uncharacterized protein n=1 Tax=Astathelohania contejeani TaxID=164912 RepID=A0ABQ7HXD3_9MICR|nr:hypothetical protein TCON_1955 [Thelohania contejeani]
MLSRGNMEEEFQNIGWHVAFSAGNISLLLISVCLGGTGIWIESFPEEEKISSILYGLSLFNVIISFIGLFIISQISGILMRRARNRGSVDTIMKIVSTN